MRNTVCEVIFCSIVIAIFCKSIRDVLNRIGIKIDMYWQEHRFSPAFSCIQATIMKELQPCCEFGRKSRGFKYIKNV